MATEKRLIDANAVDYENIMCSLSQLRWLNAIIESQPTVDAVEVVRCKDCIHWYEPEETCLKIYSDGAVSAYAWQFRKPDDFCSYGERKDND